MNRKTKLTVILILAVVAAISVTLAVSKSKAVNEDKFRNLGADVTGNELLANQTAAGNSSPGKATPKPTGKIANVDTKSKALYLTGWTVGSNAKLQQFIELAKTTEINAYVVDIKDDDGLVGYESSVPAVRQINAWLNKYDVEKVLKGFKDNGIRVIGRIVCFKDPLLSSKKPELAVKNINGGLFKSLNTDGKMITWLNPYNKGSWQYIVDIAREAADLGFDEIQFDYIRFPNDGDRKAMDFTAYTQKRHEAINEFLAFAREKLPDVVLSADVFGIICQSPEDSENIGQHLELIGKDINYISPMAYPSHYALGQGVNGVAFPKPDLDPYGVVYQTLLKAKSRIEAVEGYKVKMRPYLQAFTASWIGKGNYQRYGATQIRQQIKAVYDAGYEEWILWDPANKYPEAAFE